VPTTTRLYSKRELLNGLKRANLITCSVKSLFADAKHKIIDTTEITDPELGNCYERIGCFYLQDEDPIIFTHIKISSKNTKPELIKELKQFKRPFGDLVWDYYPTSKIESKTIYFTENIILPEYFKQNSVKYVSMHKRYIFIDGIKVAIAIEYI